MKIATMVRGYIPLPRPAGIVYAPIDLAVDIGKGLRANGHTFDFYAPEASSSNDGHISHGLRPLVKSQRDFSQFLRNVELMNHYTLGLWDQYFVLEMYKQALAGKYDILHFHHPETALAFAKMFPTVPTIYTLHDPISAMSAETYEMFRSPNQHFVSISDNQRKVAPNLPYIGTVYNGIDTSVFKPTPHKGEYLLYVGRIVPEKGIKESIQVALATGEKLVIIGPVYTEGKKYFNTHIKPFLGEQIQYLGFIEHDKLSDYYNKAKAFLMPIRWEEPFGVTVVEAMASGVPVIGFRRGSLPEIIDHGRTGFIVDNIQQMIEAVKNIDQISGGACLKHVKEKFSTEVMVRGYEGVYEKAMRDSRPVSRRISLEPLKPLRPKSPIVPRPALSR